MMVLNRSITWNVLRHILYDFKQLRQLSEVSSFYKEKRKWVPLIKREQMLEIEKIWKSRVQAENNVKKEDSDTGDRQKFYVLSMFPYPSGKLHMGHVRVYTISDTMARYHRMLGHEVIHPMGWDAFGLPAENAAKDRNLHPKEWTYSNIAIMKKQLMDLCCSFDWDRELTTCDPAYYRWTQYIFLQLYEAGLAYQAHAVVNWDPIDQTVLADEQIDEQGRSWRSGAIAEKKYLKQWFIKTTVYGKALYDGLDTVNKELWEDVVTLQKHWIGKWTGCRFEFTIKNGNEVIQDKMAVFTDSPDCIYGISHLTLDTQHMLNLEEYYKQMKKHPISGEDITLLNIEAVHPLTGHHLPIVVTNIEQEDIARRVLSSIGIPCTSEADAMIAEMFDLPWQSMLQTTGGKEVLINSKQFDGLDRHEAKEAVMSLARERGFGGHPGTKLFSDWLISRQRYWGTPIPIIHCDNCKIVPVPYEDLPVILPDNIDVSKNQSGSPLKNDKEWINVTCPKCGRPARRETDTMDTFVDSSWYFLRYLDPNNLTEPVSSTQANKYMPVDLYIGGKEHAQLHLYFARFFNYFLSDIGVLEHKEPFVDLLTQGMVKGESFRVKKTGQYIHPSEAEKKDNRYYQKATNEPLEVKYEKMSKSKLNGVDPEELFKVYGVDFTRLCILSGVAPRSDRNWNITAYDGIQRWINRVWYVTGVLVKRSEVTGTVSDQEIEEWNNKIRKFRNEYLVEINQQINTGFVLNVVIARLQEFTSDLRKVPAEVAVKSIQYERSVVDLALILAPLAPMFASELWAALSDVVVHRESYYFTKSIHQQRWPEIDSDAIIPIPITCNGKRIGYVYTEQREVDSISADRLLAMAKESHFYQKVVRDHEIRSMNVKSYGPGVKSLNLKVPEVEKYMEEKKAEQKVKKKKKKEKKTEQIDSA